jgi:hypothetical protein
MLRFILAAGALFCATASAGPITFEFTGTVSQVPVDEVFGDIVPDDAIIGNFTFDSASLDLVPGDPAVGSYQAPAGSPYTFNASIAGHSFSASDFLGVGIFNASVDQYSVLAKNNLLSETLEIFLQNDTGTVFADDSLPLSPPLLSAFGISPVAFSLDATFDAGEVQVNGTIDSLTCNGCSAAPVPEPSSAALLTAALGWCAVRTARIRNSKRRKLQ